MAHWVRGKLINIEVDENLTFESPKMDTGLDLIGISEFSPGIEDIISIAANKEDAIAMLNDLIDEAQRAIRVLDEVLL